MKNIRIQFWKIIFTYVIAFYHLLNVYRIETSWYIGVELFFILSGYFLVSSFEKREKADFAAIRFTAKRYAAFFPYTITAFTVAFLVKIIYEKMTLRRIAGLLIRQLPEVFLLESIGLNWETTQCINSVTWYLSVLLFGGLIIYFCLEYFKKPFIEFVASVSTLFIYAYLYRTYGSFREHRETLGFILNAALFRGLAAMNIGVILFYAVPLLKNAIRLKSRTMALLSDFALLSAICLAFISEPESRDFILLFFIVAGVALAFCTEAPFPIGKNTVSKWSGILLAVYLNHKIFRSVFNVVFPEFRWYVPVLYFIAVTLFAWMMDRIVRNVLKLWRKAVQRREQTQM